MKNKRHFYLIGNAHLDPVWQWRWQEGSTEAKATVRSALDRMNEFPDFKFVCSSASVYRWIKEFDEEMFEEIKLRVKQGRFIIVGGWHVQPDCNLPSGEGFARQTLYAQRFFKENFGVTAKVGYNVDSFGHNVNLPQILKKSGMDYYVFMRPAPHENNLSSDIFNWVSSDGSKVLTYRILDPYCFKFEDTEALQARIDFLNENTKTDIEAIPFFYGVGNHGGGPTIRHIELLQEYSKNHPEYEMHFSDLSDFYERVIADGYEIPEYSDDLQHHAAGCYATVSKLKNGIRRSECELVAAESYSVLAGKLCGKKYPTEKFADAWRNVCFMHFHDIMDGCSIKEAYDDTAYMYGSAQEVASVAENNALQTISWAVSTINDKQKGLPVFVFNPHSFPVKRCVKVNQCCLGVTDKDGNKVPFQLVRSTTKECYYRDDAAFIADVPALGYAVYYLQSAGERELPEGFVHDISDCNAYDTHHNICAHDCSTVVLENEYYIIRFENYSGYILSIFDKKQNKELLKEKSAVPVVIDEYYHDTWSHAKNYFTDEMARFSDADVEVVESGAIRATVKVTSRYNNSTLTQYFTLYSGSDKLEVRANVNWNEKHKMLKLKWAFDIENPTAVYEVPFGVIERPCNGEEEPGQSWFGVKGTNASFAICNSDTYSSSVNGATLYHTILRSPIYGDHGGPRSNESDYTEQGLRDFQYILMPFKENSDCIKTARVLNKGLTNIIENWHEGKIQDKLYEGLNVTSENVIVSAIKRSEDGTGIVVRIYETDGKDTDVTISGGILRCPLKTHITHYSFETFILRDNSEKWENVLLTEYTKDEQ